MATWLDSPGFLVNVALTWLGWKMNKENNTLKLLKRNTLI